MPTTLESKLDERAEDQIEETSLHQGTNSEHLVSSDSEATGIVVTSRTDGWDWLANALAGDFPKRVSFGSALVDRVTNIHEKGVPVSLSPSHFSTEQELWGSIARIGILPLLDEVAEREANFSDAEWAEIKTQLEQASEITQRIVLQMDRNNETMRDSLRELETCNAMLESSNNYARARDMQRSVSVLEKLPA